MPKLSKVKLDSNCNNIGSRPVLCSDVINSSILLPEVLEILSQKNASNSYDALVVSIHVLMLEIGFHPVGICDSEEKYDLPENWKLKETYKLSYYNVSCPSIFCEVTGVKVGAFVAIFAKVKEECNTNICDNDRTQACNLHLLVKDFIKEGSIGGKSAYHNLPKLSRYFKDQIGLPLIMGCQEEAGLTPTVGFSSLPTEIKIHILSYLDAKSLVRIGSVNKELNELANLQSLWKRLFQHGFSSVYIDDTSDYKMRYKTEYLSRIRRPRRETFVIPRLPYLVGDPLAEIWPDRFFNIQRTVAPEVPSPFPYVRILHPSMPQGPFP